jgi:hypothetical protein
MSALMMKMLQPYCKPLEEGADGGGGAVDRGDEVVTSKLANGEEDAQAAKEAAEKAAADEAAAAEKLAEEAAARKAADEAAAAAAKEEQARDEKTGKFAKRDDAHIPKARFDEAVNKERQAREAAENKLIELQKQLKTVDRAADNEKLETEITALEQQHTKLMLDGESDKAAAVMKEIRLKERQIGIATSTAMSEAAKEQAREDIRFDMAVEKLEETYPEFNPKHEKFDRDLVTMVVALQGHKIGEGLSPSKALIAAAEDVMKRLVGDGGKPKEEKKEDESLSAAKGATDRKAAAVEKNLDTAKRQPASTSVAGKDSDKGGEKAVGYGEKGMIITPEEFAAMPESTKSKLRGDVL